jgi:hypothetical protein
MEVLYQLSYLGGTLDLNGSRAGSEGAGAAITDLDRVPIEER